MNRSILAVTALSGGLLLGGIGQSQVRAEDQPNPPRAEQDRSPQGFPMLDRVRSLLNDLKLSDDQKSKIDTMFEDARSQLTKLRDDTSGDRATIGRKSREVFTKLRENVSSALNDEQKEQFKQKLQRLSGRTGDLVARLRSSLEKLKLGDDQKQKVKDLLEETQSKAKDLRQEAQAGSEDAQQKLRALMQDTREKLGRILNDDQKKELQQDLRPDEGGTRPAPEKK